MAEIKRRDEAPEPKKEPKKETTEATSGGVSRREFLVGSGAGVAGLVIGGVVGSQVIGKPAAPVAEAPVVEAPAEGEVSNYKAGYNLVFDSVQCTGCNNCVVACAEKYATYHHPEETANVVNLEFARIRTMRFQVVDVMNFCGYCTLFEWAEGSSEYPCAAVCPEDAIITVPEGEGVEGYYGMGYKWIDQDKCLGLDACWRCAEICEDQFGSGISFDPINRKAQVCSRCGGDPECVKACPEYGALKWTPAARNGRYHVFTPTDHAELLYRKIYNHVREL